MSLHILEIFASFQGEINIGQPSIFVRFAGCNMKPLCEFCDTIHENRKVEEMSPRALFTEIERHCKISGIYHIVFTGGEPMMQLTTDEGKDFLQLFTEFNINTRHLTMTYSVETNGTIDIPYGMESKLPLESITISPKKELGLIRIPFKNVKILYPYVNGITAEEFDKTFPLFDGGKYIMGIHDKENNPIVATRKAWHEVQRLNRSFPTNPNSNLLNSWRLTMQAHKLIGAP